MLVRVFAGGVAVLATLSLSNWFLGTPAAISGATWPMSIVPHAAALLALLAVAVWRLAGRSPGAARLDTRRWTATGLVGGLVAASGLERLAEVALGTELSFDDELIATLSRWAGRAEEPTPIPFPTAVCLALAGIATLLLAGHLHRPAPRLLAAQLAAACAVVGGVFALGYVYGRPLSYAGQDLAMLPGAATAFVLLGSALVGVVIRHESDRRARVLAGLRRAGATLERRVGERTVQLNRALDSLRAESQSRVRTEVSLIHAQKMRCIGQLAAGLAHDFNNLLFVIRSSVDLLETHLTPLPTALELLRRIREATIGGSQITKRLLGFAGDSADAPRTRTEPAELLRESLELVRPALGSRIRADAEAEAGLWPIHADRASLQQVLLNLCINAKDAMPQGGTLSLRAANANLKEPLPATPELVPAGEYVVLEVKDSGSGMSDDTLARLFEPFFTTKPKGEGTGLGLATSYHIMQRHGGSICVESAPGTGTLFRRFLPKA
jgi:signal transduction histidine kinase